MATLRREIRTRETIEGRRQQSNLTELLKSGARVRNQTRKKGETVTLTFSGTPEIDEIIDYWAKAWAVGRSYVFRQAILMTDLNWRREYGKPDDQEGKVETGRGSRRSRKR